MLMQEAEAGILRAQFFPESPDSKIEISLHDVVKQDHTTAAHLGLPCFKVVANRLVSVVTVDMKQVDFPVREAAGCLVEGHRQQRGKGSITMVMIIPQLLKHFQAVVSVVRIALPRIHGKGARR